MTVADIRENADMYTTLPNLDAAQNRHFEMSQPTSETTSVRHTERSLRFSPATAVA